MQRAAIALLRMRWFNATRVQGTYRSFVAKRLAMKKFREMMDRIKGVSATKVQRLFRGWKCRRVSYQMKCGEAAKRLYASRIIMRGWIRFRDGIKYRRAKEAWEVEQSAEMLMDLDEERREILDDLEDIELDVSVRAKSLKRLKRRITEIIDFDFTFLCIFNFHI